MKIALTGATGFIGRYLENHLSEQGHEVVPLGRSELKQGSKRVAASISGCDALINLAGATISRRWTDAYKQEMVSSRVKTTKPAGRRHEPRSINHLPLSSQHRQLVLLIPGEDTRNRMPRTQSTFSGNSPGIGKQPHCRQNPWVYAP